MATGKKFYWLKLDKSFFKRHDIQIIESQTNGKDYVLFYLKLLLESISHEGQLRFNETVPYDEEMLATITNTNVDIVRSAIKIFTQLGLMSIYDDKTIYMEETTKMLGYETDWAKKKRIYRENQKMLVGTKKDNVRQELDKELDKELDIEKDKKETKHEYGEYKHVLLTDSQYEKLKKDFPKDYEKMITNLDEGIEMKGYVYKNHNLAIRNWAKRDKPKESKIVIPKSKDVDEGEPRIHIPKSKEAEYKRRIEEMRNARKE